MPENTIIPVLYLMCGLPGSGKTTLARILEKEYGAIRFSPDEWLYDLGLSFYDDQARIKVEQLQWQLALQLLKQGHSVILEYGFWLRTERDHYRAVAKELGVIAKVCYLKASIDELKSRLKKRNQLGIDSIPVVDLANLDQWINRFEEPAQEELS
ncbi:ATP-binding protein [Acinetobacter radioresistens]|jgi:predicted kinase|uniref:AAA family ATPase n=1 Tax=Acinetobacter radioresistens TaxID=40216 RepID=UPI000DAE43EA|nr:ATP-binding protein [Acinetobacter radioresistens]AWV86994.1 ATP-binding protein [Acinetobacter radioresistens]MCK4087588.1 ATP-binding protein [Acinetobacter radioresistens]MCK4109273.1 ATP-binding protein [Acinetobacter radioresistens]MCX0329234.1 ATP-binding protein [Acinetobacter radioresistens]HCK64044.1 ATP-binding protein [Acinetobacter radioresistens]